MRLRVLLAVVLGVLLCSPGSLQSQDDAAARLLNLTRDSKSLPLWTKPKPQDKLDLAKQVTALHPGIFIIGHPKVGKGTGFVVSQEHRLIATNAHVADILYSARELFAIGNNSTQVFKVEQVWYHPGVIRNAKGVLLRSQSPGYGDVHSRCPDVALLRVGGTEKLPPALPLATPKELESLFAQPVGMLGFPGHDTLGWPGIGEKPQATYRQGIIARATDFDNDANAKTADLQFLQHTMANWFGFSGSPIFLTNGHVAAINNSGGTLEKDGVTTTLAYGIRIDSLWELVAYHRLQYKLRLPVPVADLRLARFEGKDPGLKKYDRVNDLLTKSIIERNQGKFVEAEKLANEAIKIAPNYAYAHSVKSLNHSHHAAFSKLSAAAKLEQRELAVKHSKIALLLRPNDVGYLLSTVFELTAVKHRQALNRSERVKDVPETATVARNVLAMEGLEPSRKAHAYSVLAVSSASALDRIKWYSKAIDNWPYEAVYYVNRARQHESLGDQQKAATDRAKTDTLRKAQVLFEESKLEKDPAKAVRLAQEACQLTNYSYYAYLERLAFAHHKNGDYAEAVRWSEKAWKLVESWPDGEIKSGIARNLDVYRKWVARK